MITWFWIILGPVTLTVNGESVEGNLLSHSKSAVNQEILNYLTPQLLQVMKLTMSTFYCVSQYKILNNVDAIK